MLQWSRIETPNTHYGHSLESSVGRRSYIAWQQSDRTWTVRRYLNSNHLHAKVDGIPNWVDTRLAVDLAEQLLTGRTTSQAQSWFAERVSAEKISECDEEAIIKAANRLIGAR